MTNPVERNKGPSTSPRYIAQPAAAATRVQQQNISTFKKKTTRRRKRRNTRSKVSIAVSGVGREYVKLKTLQANRFFFSFVGSSIHFLSLIFFPGKT